MSSVVQKVTYTDVNKKALLNCTVRAYPAITKADVAIWHKGSTILLSDVSVTSVKTKSDETVIEMTFDPVTVDDYGLYDVELDNNIGEKVRLQLSLMELGNSLNLYCLLFW